MLATKKPKPNRHVIHRPSQHTHPAALLPYLQPKVKLLIDGNFQDSQADRWVNVTNPVSQAGDDADPAQPRLSDVAMAWV